MNTSTYAPVALLALAAYVSFAAESEDPKPGDSKIWSGVYTTAQAERGRENFEQLPQFGPERQCASPFSAR